MEILKYRKDANSPWMSIAAIVGPPGPEGPIGKTGATGQQGQRGERGERGSDGYSLYATRDEVQKRVSIIQRQGTNGGQVTQAYLYDGKDGVNGKDGYTPVKGVDYFDGKDYVLTQADKNTIAELVLAALPNAEGVKY